uniref:Uncharacterized protein n=1 Tax=Hucho hucho TaxID=62062 RepID=A0A4W5MUT6_9TELE
MNTFNCSLCHPQSVTCEESEDVIPPEWMEIPQASPSRLLALKVAVLPEDFGAIRLNISWAINIDESINYLTGTWIRIGDDTYRCRYQPPFGEVDLRGLEQLWFYYLAPAEPGLHLVISAYNLPIPAEGEYSQYTTCNVPFRKYIFKNELLCFYSDISYIKNNN